VLVLRNEDLDGSRCKPEFVDGMYQDLKWAGFQWQEGPDCGGKFGPYNQSDRRDRYEQAFEKLKESGLLYPCVCSRQDVLKALSAPHEGDEEPVYPGICRQNASTGDKASWRFRVTDGEVIEFNDGSFGPQKFIAGKDFGDFVVWRHDGVPSYQLAVTVDDAAMEISEVVRGADLLVSTARQILLYRALGMKAPNFYHCSLVTDENGVRLAKRHDALSLRNLRNAGLASEHLSLMLNTDEEKKTQAV
jgi:glutamyl/glutaminyl-tRNA synthetase